MLRLRTADEDLKLEQKRQEIERSRMDIEEERNKRQIAMARDQQEYQLMMDRKSRTQEREEDEADALLGMRLLAQMKEIRRKDDEDAARIRRLDEEETLRIRRVDELERRRAEMQIMLERMEMEERLRQNEREHLRKTQESTQEFELRRLSEIGKLGPEALISISGVEQGRVLADLKKSEALKGMSEEQILAMAAENSPEVAKAFQEKYRAIAEGRTSVEVKEMYERLGAGEGQFRAPRPGRRRQTRPGYQGSLGEIFRSIPANHRPRHGQYYSRSRILCPQPGPATGRSANYHQHPRTDASGDPHRGRRSGWATGNWRSQNVHKLRPICPRGCEVL